MKKQCKGRDATERSTWAQLRLEGRANNSQQGAEGKDLWSDNGGKAQRPAERGRVVQVVGSGSSSAGQISDSGERRPNGWSLMVPRRLQERKTEVIH